MERREQSFILAFDVGTTGLKTCLYRFGSASSPEHRRIELLADSSEKYGLRLGAGGEAEQDVDDWWYGMGRSAKRALSESGVSASEVSGISFCSQMQALVLVDDEGRALRPAMSYMDSRAEEEKRDFGGSLPRIAGLGVDLLLPSLAIAGGAAASAKDPVWKYRWVQRHEGALFGRVHKWLDAKEYLVARATGRFTMSRDSAYATFLMDSRRGRAAWSPLLARLHGVELSHLPEIVSSTDLVGPLGRSPAEELGLAEGTPVFSGGGDASLIGVGAGAVAPGDTHVYIGTSGWVSTVVTRRIVDTKRMIASVVGATPGRYNYFAEQETSGKCLEWVRDHLALDEVGIYLAKEERKSGQGEEWRSLIDYLVASIEEEKPGSDGVVFAPWLRGSRCPEEDPNTRGIFFNIGLDTGKRALIRAVVEGIALNKRLLLEAQEAKVPTSPTLRFAGGGALSDGLCRILADATGRTVEAVADPQNAGALGAALTAAAGLGLIESLDEAKELVPVRATFVSDPASREAYERNFRVLAGLHKANAAFFRQLNGG